MSHHHRLIAVMKKMEQMMHLHRFSHLSVNMLQCLRMRKRCGYEHAAPRMANTASVSTHLELIVPIPVTFLTSFLAHMRGPNALVSCL